RLLVEDLARVQRGERHLAGADQVERVVGQAVDLLLGVGQEAGAVHGLLAHENWGNDRLVAVGAQALERPAHERELEHDEVAAQVGEARAGDARARLHVDHRPGQLEVVATGAPGLADLAQDAVALRRLVGGHVRQRGLRVAELGLDLRQLGRELLLTRAELLHRRDRVARVLARALGRADGLAGLVLARAQLLELGQQLAAARVEREHPVERLADARVAAPVEGGAHGVGLAADAPQVEHRVGYLAALRPEYFARNSATARASRPVTMFSGMIAPEKPPLRIA